ncbi:MAG: hypothetical protein CO023_05425 [Flavobacteriales bacterium CG_4_9_14_0_2_um_filter_35_242]|nr:MAG: hypothetical protein CO023_05425 [Flavobacteriales bacterium CG_4_9_14_0_2_um_filter_35_242]
MKKNFKHLCVAMTTLGFMGLPTVIAHAQNISVGASHSLNLSTDNFVWVVAEITMDNKSMEPTQIEPVQCY